MSNDDISVQHMKSDDDIDDDVDITDWKEPIKSLPSSSREEEGRLFFYLFVL
jgi:hypothetical protein